MVILRKTIISVFKYVKKYKAQQFFHTKTEK